MSLLVEKESTRAKQRYLVEIKPSRRIIVARPGSRTHLMLNLDSSYRLELRLAVEGLTPDIARYSLAPERRNPIHSKTRPHNKPRNRRYLPLQGYRSECARQ